MGGAYEKYQESEININKMENDAMQRRMLKEIEKQSPL